MPDLAATVDLFQLFADPSRVRLLALLARDELSVAELTSVTEMAQSRVSTHLARLREAGLLRDRRVGASTLYALNDGAMPIEARQLWELTRGELKDTVLEADRKRCDAVLAARTRSAGWPDALAGQMERHYSPGRTWESMARSFVGLVRLGDVLDVGAGDGSVAQLLAPRAKSITCLDRSERMIDAARTRLAKHEHVRFRVADMHRLPFDDESFDQTLLLNVLAHAETPSRAVAECARVLRPGGDLVLSTIDAHDRGEVTATYHHLHAGFSPGTVRGMLTRAGLTVEQCEVTSRERRPPYFQVVTAFARKAPSARRRRTSDS